MTSNVLLLHRDVGRSVGQTDGRDADVRAWELKAAAEGHFDKLGTGVARFPTARSSIHSSVVPTNQATKESEREQREREIAQRNSGEERFGVTQ